MNLTKLLTTLLLTAGSLSAQAGLIDYAGFSFDTTTKLTSGQGLEWRLSTEYDTSHGINSFDGKGNSEGWRTATTAEVASTLNAFKPLVHADFVADENINQGYHSGWFGSNFNAMVKFHTMFGGYRDSLIHPSWSMVSLRFRFGEDLDADSKLNNVWQMIEWFNYDDWPLSFHPDFFNPITGQYAMADSMALTISKDGDDTRLDPLLLVRDLNYVATVPEPTPLILLVIGIVGLIAKRHFNARKA